MIYLVKPRRDVYLYVHPNICKCKSKSFPPHLFVLLLTCIVSHLQNILDCCWGSCFKNRTFKTYTFFFCLQYEKMNENLWMLWSKYFLYIFFSLVYLFNRLTDKMLCDLNSFYLLIDFKFMNSFLLYTLDGRPDTQIWPGFLVNYNPQNDSGGTLYGCWNTGFVEMSANFVWHDCEKLTFVKKSNY